MVLELPGSAPVVGIWQPTGCRDPEASGEQKFGQEAWLASAHHFRSRNVNEFRDQVVVDALVVVDVMPVVVGPVLGPDDSMLDGLRSRSDDHVDVGEDRVRTEDQPRSLDGRYPGTDDEQVALPQEPRRGFCLGKVFFVAGSLPEPLDFCGKMAPAFEQRRRQLLDLRRRRVDKPEKREWTR